MTTNNKVQQARNTLRQAENAMPVGQCPPQVWEAYMAAKNACNVAEAEQYMERHPNPPADADVRGYYW